MLVYIGRKRDMLVYIGLSLLVSSVVGQMHPVPPPPPYNMYGPVNPYMPQPMMPPPMSPYPASTSVSYATYPMIPSAAAPYPAYGIPAPPLQSQPMMYPPPYQTFSGSGPMGDPFTSSTGYDNFFSLLLSHTFNYKNCYQNFIKKNLNI